MNRPRLVMVAALAITGTIAAAPAADAHAVVCTAHIYQPTYVGGSTDKIVYGVKFDCTPSIPEMQYIYAQARKWYSDPGVWRDWGTETVYQCGYGGRPACTKNHYTVFDWTYCVTGKHILATQGYLEGYHHRWEQDGPSQSYPSVTVYCDGQPRKITPEQQETIDAWHQWVATDGKDWE